MSPLQAARPGEAGGDGLERCISRARRAAPGLPEVGMSLVPEKE